jgi:hypothetical protein
MRKRLMDFDRVPLESLQEQCWIWDRMNDESVFICDMKMGSLSVAG